MDYPLVINQVKMLKINKSIKLTKYCSEYKGTTCVYMITNPEGGSYVGVTTNLYKRLFHHANGHKYKTTTNSLLVESVVKYGFDNHCVEILWSAVGVSEEIGFEMEEKFIKEKNTFNTVNPKGLNLRSSYQDNSHLASKVRTCKPVHQYDMSTGDYIRSFASSHEAVRVMGVGHVSGISDARDGKVRHSYGYFWSAEKMDNYIPEEVGHLALRTPIYKMDRFCTSILDRYRNLLTAAAKNKINRNKMVEAVKNMEEVGGFIFLKAS